MPAIAATIAGAVAIALAFSKAASNDVFERLGRGKRPWPIALACALLSLGYVAWYLRGGPRIIDATTYWHEARTMAHGSFSFEVPDPTASFRGRFFLYRDHHVAGIFPPGYPLLLAMGFVFGAPLVIGPLLAAAIALVTHTVSKQLGASENTARFAALLSLACAALRYHTADTMSHGAAALGIALAFSFGLRMEKNKRDAILAGLALGWVISTRIPSALGVACVCAYFAWRAKKLPWLAIGALPGIALLLLSQKAATGHLFTFAQPAYYRASDGPPGCFQGFGAGVGCVFEHGDVVASRLQHGYGIGQVLLTSLRRIWKHADDVLDGWPLALALVPFLVRAARSSAAGKAIGAIIGLQILAYAPFYFDGNYPGGGARHLADLLPLEHALVAVAVSKMTMIATFEQRAMAVLGACALLFGVHSSAGHVQLQARDGGKPMFEPDELAKNGVTRGLVFVDTDHGFALAHDPAVTTTDAGIFAARWRDDAHDRLLYDRLAHPPSYLYRFDQQPPVVSWTPPAAVDEAGREQWRFESEVDWPPLDQSGGYAIPRWASATCASSGRVLDLVSGTATIALPVPRTDRWRIVPRLLRRPKDGAASLQIADARWSVDASEGPEITCVELAPMDLDLKEGEIPVILTAYGGSVALDRIVLGRPPL